MIRRAHQDRDRQAELLACRFSSLEQALLDESPIKMSWGNQAMQLKLFDEVTF
jgi:hypothetical protein